MRTKYIFYFICVLFSLLIVRLVKFVYFDSSTLVNNTYNRRLSSFDAHILRGDILDANGEVLATTELDGGVSTRVYPYKSKFAHIVGFSGYTQQGVEGGYSLDLTRVDNEFLARLQNVLHGEPLRGNTVKLTLDARLQTKAFELMDGRRGAFIAIEPSTGKILACVSNPAFDPNKVAFDWEDLSNDNEDNPLLNRALQGLYPPGSTFKIVTALSEYRNIKDYQNFTYKCVGSQTFEDYTIHCYNNNKHGEVDIKKAFAKSCNTYFATVGENIGGRKLAETADSLLFNKLYPLNLNYVRSSFVLNDKSDANEIAQTSIGQGKTLVTPMHMLLLTAAAANDGLLMKPYIADSIESPTGKQLRKVLPEPYGQLISEEESRYLRELMRGVVTDGTATELDKYKFEVAGKTGTAENTGKDHGWFVCFAGETLDAPKVAVVVLLENAGGSSKTLPVAGEFIKYALSL
ncbi:penicillin-binding protein [Clostridia bacterium]|nr:penicillin-binding protein [Clostridia bacterium]